MHYSWGLARRAGGGGKQAIGRWLLRIAPAVGALCLSALAAEAQTWSANPGSSDWNTGTNWVGGSVPGDAAIFGASSTTTLTFSAPGNTDINTLQFNAGAPAYIFSIGTQELNINGLGIVNNSSNATTFSVNGGALTFNNSSAAGNAVINVNGGANVEFSDTASAGNAVINATTGIVGFNGTATAGNATINLGGTSQLFFSSPNSSGGNARVVNNGQRVDFSPMGSSATTLGSIEGGGKFYLGAVKLAVGSNGIDTLVSGVISDCGSGSDCQFPSNSGGSLVKVGAGTLTLSGANKYTGGTTVSDGTLRFTNASSLGTGAVTLDGGTLQAGAAVTLTNAFSLNTTGGVIDTNGFDTQFSGVLANGNGSGSFTKAGAGILTLSSANTYTGGTTLSAGGIKLGNAGALGSGRLTVVGSGSLETTGNFTIGNGISLSNGARLTLAGTSDFKLTGVINGSGGLTVSGTGVVTLSGNNLSPGGVNLNSGGIILDDVAALGPGTLTVGGNASLDATAPYTFTNVIQLNGGSTLSLLGSTALTLRGAIAGTGNLTKTGAGTLTLGGASSFTGTLDIGVGAVALGANGSLSSTSTVNLSGVGATLDISGASANQTIGALAGVAGTTVALGANTLTVGGLDGDTVYGGTFSGGSSGKLVKTGTGTLTLSGASTYSGGTTISTGKIVVGNGSALGAGAVDMADGSALGFLGNSTISNSFTLAGDAAFDVGAANTDTVSGIIGDGASAGTLVKTGAGTLTLSGANTYSGGTTIDAGTLRLGREGALGTGGLDTTNAGTLELNGFDQTVTTLDGQAGSFITNSLGAATLTVAGSGEFDGIIKDGAVGTIVGLTKTGSGALTLNGVNAYTGLTQVSGGTLIVGGDGHSGAAIPSGVFVASGGTLGGHGSVGSTVIDSGGTLAPGASIGTLTVNGDLTIRDGAKLDFEFGAPGPNFSTPGQSDNVHVTGNLSIGSSTLNVINTGSMGPGLYNLFGWGGTLSITGGGFAPPPGTSLQILTADKQINLINTNGLTLNFWNANGLASSTQLGGGSGTWSRHSQNWTNADGSVTAAMSPQPGFAIFGGAAGTVTVDNSGGAIAVTGMQFASDGYTLNGNPLSLVADADHPAPIEIRVGDGSAGSAAWTATIDNVVANNNGLRKTGAGTLVLNGANIYAGGTTLEAGTLSVSSDGNLGNASSGLTFNGGTLKVTGTAYTSTARAVTLTGAGTIDIADAANRFMLNAVVSGDGSLTKQGAGTLRLGEANTYTGATIINAGTLSLKGPGSIATSSSLTINGGAFDLTGFGNDTSVNNLSGTGGAVILASSTLTINQSVDGLFAGTISGAGGWIKTGTAKLILDGDSSASSGLTAVEAGTLVVGSTEGSTAKLGGSLTVGDTATLMGYGRIGSGAGSTVTIASGGTVSPGGSIGTLTIDGDYVQQAGSTYFAEIAPDGTSDLISVTGAATIEGGTVYASKETGSYTPGTNYKILTAVDGVSGAYDTLDQNTPFVDLKLTYDPNAVYIRAVRNNVDFCAVAASANQCAVANAVEGLADGNTLFDAVAGVPSADVARSAFEQLSGNIHAAGKSVLVETSELIGDLIDARLRSAFGAVAADSAPVLAYGEQGTDNRATAAIDGQLAPADTLAPAAWGTAFGDWGHVGGDTRTSSSTGGFLTGIDAALGGGWRGGVVAGYSHTSFDSDKESGDSQNWHLGLYGGNQWGALGFRAGAAYTWHDLSTARGVDFPGFSDHLSADYDAATAQVFGELAYDLKAGAVGLEPFVNLSYINLHTDGFTEKGGAAALTSASSTTDATFTTLGLRASTEINLGSMTATARGTLGWRHAYDDTAEAVFTIDGSDPFTITSPIARDAALIEAGLDFALSPNATLGLDYRGQLASHASQNGFNARLDVQF